MVAAIRVVDRIQDQGDFAGPLTDGQFLAWSQAAGKFLLQAPPVPPPTTFISQAGGSVAMGSDGSISLSPASGKQVSVSGGTTYLSNPTPGSNQLVIGSLLNDAHGAAFLGGDGGNLSIYRADQATLGSLTVFDLNTGNNVMIGGGNDVYLYRDGTGVLAQRNGTNPQTFRVYDSYTDANNGSWLESFWGGNFWFLRTHANGTGSPSELGLMSGADSLILGVYGQGVLSLSLTQFLPYPDDTVDLGSATQSWRNIYAGTSVNIGTTATGNAVELLRSNSDGDPQIRMFNSGHTDGYLVCKSNNTFSFSVGITTEYGDIVAAGNVHTFGGLVDISAPIGADNLITFTERGVANQAAVGFAAGSNAMDFWLNGAYNLHSGTHVLRLGAIPNSYLRLYNSYTDSNNGEWLDINWTDQANVCTIATKANGTGTVRQLRFSNQIAADGLSVWNTLGVSTYALLLESAASDGRIRIRNTGNVSNAGIVFYANQVIEVEAGTDLHFSGNVALPNTVWYGNTTSGGGSNNYLRIQSSTESDPSSIIDLWTLRYADAAYPTMAFTAPDFQFWSTAGNWPSQLRNGSNILSISGSTGTPTQRVLLNTGAAGSKGLVIQGAPLQSAPLQEWQDVAGALAAAMGPGPGSYFRLYSTYTDASNGEWLEAGWYGGYSYLVTNQNGTGASRDLRIGTTYAANVVLQTNAGARWIVDGPTGHLGGYGGLDIGYGPYIPRNIFAAGALSTGVKAGAAADGDVSNPSDGMLRVDSTNNRLYVRVNGVWKYAQLT